VVSCWLFYSVGVIHELPLHVEIALKGDRELKQSERYSAFRGKKN
jgi:hypothetical protein